MNKITGKQLKKLIQLAIKYKADSADILTCLDSHELDEASTENITFYPNPTKQQNFIVVLPDGSAHS